MPQDGSEFYVRLDGIKLPAEAEKRIDAEIRSTVLRELGRLDLKQPDIAFRRPKEWLGIWLRGVKLPQDPMPMREVGPR